MWKINRLLKFYIKDNSIIFKIVWSNKILKINFSSNLYEFLVYIEENVFFDLNIIESYSISSNLILLLEKENFISKIEQTWIETSFIHSFIKNNNLNIINDKWLEKIYSSYFNTVKEILNIDKLFLFDWKIEDLKFKLNEKDFIKPKSIRLKDDDLINYNNLKNILSVIKFIFKKDFNNNFKSLYASWWGLYSIFPVYVSRNDKVFIYDGFNDKFYYFSQKWIFNNLSEKWFIKSSFWIDFSKYNWFVLLLGNSNYVRKKYDNLWYILQLIEVWEIAYLFRLLSVRFDLKYLEVQWFYHTQVVSILENMDIFSKKVDLYHIICI